MREAKVAQVAAALATRGFVRIDRPAAFTAVSASDADAVDLWYHGMLAAARGGTDILLRVTDLSLVTAPSIWLAERPSWLQGWRPHLLGTDALPFENLCYNDFEQYQLLAHDLGAAVLRVLEDATATIDRISDPQSVVSDSRKDFPRLWTSGFQDVYIDSIPTLEETQCKTASWEDKRGRVHLLVSSDPFALAARLGWPTDKLKTAGDALVYPDEGEGLYLTASGPPRNLREVRDWLARVSPKTFARWHTRVRQPTFYQHRIKHHFFVSRGQVIGFFADYPNTLRRTSAAKGAREAYARTVYREPLSITRMHAERLDHEYLVRRNLPPGQADLRGKRVLLIGAGAVGSFLAQSLVQLGAGLPDLQGTAGALTICDRDHLSPGNIGRHLLGLRFLGKMKARAVCEYLRDWNPSCNAKPVVGDYRPDGRSIAEFDLIIDATGYETYSRFLSRLCRSSGWLDKAGHGLLQIWIEGRGAVVRGLLQEATRDACYDCLWNYAAAIEPAPRHGAYSDQSWNAHGDDGYATMTPFAVSAVHSAVAVAVDMLTTRGAHPAAPKFVSRAVDAPGVHKGVAKTLARASQCPGCTH